MASPAPTLSDALEALLALSAPVRPGPRHPAAAWLKARRVFRPTWEAQGLRVVEDYRGVMAGLEARFDPEALRRFGLFNAEGHLRFYRHVLLFPFFDPRAEGRPVFVQARALDEAVKPPELALFPAAPCPYNARLLDGSEGRLYLCGGVLDTLTLLEAGFPAVGLAGPDAFRPEWAGRFQNKSVHVAFSGDANGEAEAAKVLSLLAENGIDAHRLSLPPGMDVNAWLRTGGLGAAP